MGFLVVAQDRIPVVGKSKVKQLPLPTGAVINKKSFRAGMTTALVVEAGVDGIPSHHASWAMANGGNGVEIRTKGERE